MVAADEIIGVDVAVVTVSSDLNGTFAIKWRPKTGDERLFAVVKTFL